MFANGKYEGGRGRAGGSLEHTSAERDKLPPAEGRVLLHACCAPCSGAIVESLVRGGVRPVIFFSNSNIFPAAEFEKRLGEVLRYAALYGLETVRDEYEPQAWLEAVKGLEDEPERGARCAACFRFRLERAAAYASEHGFSVLATTLASSRWKDLAQVNAAGEEACAKYPGVTWWDRNWRKGGLQERRGQIIKEQNFYNQLYCGCPYSENYGISED